MSLMTDLIPWTRSRGSDLQRAAPDPFFSLQREINRVFDDAWRGIDLPTMRQGRDPLGWPSVELQDDEKQLTVVAELPGMNEKDVEVMLENDVLVLRGERRSEREDVNRQFSERYYGRFERHIPLPVEVQADRIEAQFRNGLLTINMPKSENARSHTRRIPIRHG
jgi:HSP20 family protein